TKNLLSDTLPDGSSFGLNFNDEPPRVIIPFNWYVKYIEIEFSYNPAIAIKIIPNKNITPICFFI
ncbi:hypothetical protein LCGC14_1684230, partial [marine sediment metagenome]